MRQRSGTSHGAAEKVVKDIRRKTRRQFSAEEKIRIVLEGLRGEVEQGKVPVVLGHLEANADRPNVLWHQRTLLADDAALVPSRSAGSNGR